MDEFYILLSKHFRDETSQKEDRIISEFKKKNPKEYLMLKRYWLQGNIKVSEFNTTTAWKQFNKLIEEKYGEKISPYRNIRKWATSVAAIAIILISFMFIFNEIIKTKEIIVNNQKDIPKEIILSDGTKIQINTNSTLTYPNKFKENKRVVTLNGEAYFKVSENKEKPFVINTSNTTIEVLGTSFNVRNTDSSTEINVETGKVSITNELTNQNTIIIKGQTAIVTPGGLQSFETSNPNFSAWQSGIFTFENTPLKNVISDLQKFYKGNIEIDTSFSYNCNLTADFNNASLEEITNVIKLTCRISVEKSDNIYFIAPLK
jgi:transmembrane sensor